MYISRFIYALLLGSFFSVYSWLQNGLKRASVSPAVLAETVTFFGVEPPGAVTGLAAELTFSALGVGADGATTYAEEQKQSRVVLVDGSQTITSQIPVTTLHGAFRKFFQIVQYANEIPQPRSLSKTTKFTILNSRPLVALTTATSALLKTANSTTMVAENVLTRSGWMGCPQRALRHIVAGLWPSIP